MKKTVNNMIARIVCPVVLALFAISFMATAMFVAAVSNAGEPVRERIEWCNIWVTNADKDDLPRVLFIGDSITQGYFSEVEKLIGGQVNCARITTSRSVCDPIYYDELSLILKQYDFSVVHFNNGLHGWGHTEDEYREGLKKLFAVIQKQAPDAGIVWASSTPVLSHSGMAEHADRVTKRNAIARRLAEDANIPVNDLHTLVDGHDGWYSKDGVHFNAEGKKAQAEQVARVVGDILGKN